MRCCRIFEMERDSGKNNFRSVQFEMWHPFFVVEASLGGWEWEGMGILYCFLFMLFACLPVKVIKRCIRTQALKRSSERGRRGPASQSPCRSEATHIFPCWRISGFAHTVRGFRMCLYYVFNSVVGCWNYCLIFSLLSQKDLITTFERWQCSSRGCKTFSRVVQRHVL